MYAARQIGHVVLRRTNQETRHSAWNSWPQLCSLRMASGSEESGVIEVAFAVGGRMAASSMVGWDCISAGPGGEGAWRAERHIALEVVSIVQ